MALEQDIKSLNKAITRLADKMDQAIGLVDRLPDMEGVRALTKDVNSFKITGEEPSEETITEPGEEPQPEPQPKTKTKVGEVLSNEGIAIKKVGIPGKNTLEEEAKKNKAITMKEIQVLAKDKIALNRSKNKVLIKNKIKDLGADQLADLPATKYKALCEYINTLTGDGEPEEADKE